MTSAYHAAIPCAACGHEGHMTTPFDAGESGKGDVDWCQDCPPEDCAHAYVPAALSASGVAEQARRIEALEADNAELNTLFDLQRARSIEATALWRAEAPTERALIMPDLGKLLAWLTERAVLSAAALASTAVPDFDDSACGRMCACGHTEFDDTGTTIHVCECEGAHNPETGIDDYCFACDGDAASADESSAARHPFTPVPERAVTQEPTP